MPTNHAQIPEWSPPPPSSAGLGPGEIHLWRVPVEENQPPGLVDRRHAILSPEERERAARFRFPVDAARFILCRGALRILLGRYTGSPPERISLSCGPNGKPGLADQHASSLEFSVSHSGNFALLGFTSQHPLGVDIEHLRPMPDADALAERFFSPAEREEYHSLTPNQRPLGFFNCWTRKESFVKAVGEGLSRPLDSFDVTLAPDQPARFRRIGSTQGENLSWSLLSFQAAPEYIAATAIACRTPSPSFHEFRND